MTTMPPPGWYPDPASYDLERWWNGSTWSESTRARFPQPSAPIPPAAAPAWGTAGPYATATAAPSTIPFATPVHLADAFARFFRYYAEFRGTASRSEYWYSVLAFFLISIPVMFLDSIATAGMLGTLLSLGILIPSLAVTVRRLRDAGLHWAVLFVLFVPLAGPIALIVMLCLPASARARW